MAHSPGATLIAIGFPGLYGSRDWECGFSRVALPVGCSSLWSDNEANQTVQRTGASRFVQRQIQRHRRLAPVADLRVLPPKAPRTTYLYGRSFGWYNRGAVLLPPAT